MTTFENSDRRERVAGLVALLAFSLFAVPSIRAQEHEEAHEAAGEHGEGAEPMGGHAVHAHYKNGAALFLGGTRESAEEQTFLTVGFEYERLLADRWALQLVGEYVHDFDALVVIAPVGFRLAGTLWAMAGPGFETESRRSRRQSEPSDDQHSTDPHEEGKGPFFLWRFGFMYAIHLGESGRFALTPSLSLDLVREHGEWVEAWVFGVGLTVHF
jgi:hypothetical protein